MTQPQKIAQMQHYWDNLDHMASDEIKKKNMKMRFGIRNIKLGNRGRKYYHLKRIEIIKLNTKSFNHQKR